MTPRIGTKVRVVVNGQEQEIEPGAKLSRLVKTMEADLTVLTVHEARFMFAWISR